MGNGERRNGSGAGGSGAVTGDVSGVVSGALLFDLDGTLIHSDALHFEVFADFFAERGQVIDLDFYNANIHGRSNLDMFPAFFPDADAKALSDEKEARFRDRLSGRVPPMPGAEALLDRAGKAGWQVGVVTNAPRDNAEHMLRAIGLRDAFDVLVIGEECARGKPDPEPYLAAMRALGVPPEVCIAFEDSPSGTRAARASGAYTVGIRSSASHDTLRAAGAHASVHDFTDAGMEDILARLARKAMS